MQLRGSIFVSLLVLAAVAGCTKDDSLANVEGVVRLDGQPLTSGTVRFIPPAGRAASGQIQPDGTYRLGTYGESDGALVGTHKVAIIAYQGGGDSRPAYEARGQSSKPLVPERYMAPGTSGLTFEVKRGKNQADFQLESR
jgi:hypothetical protein